MAKMRKNPIPKKEDVPAVTVSKSEIITPQVVMLPPGKCTWRYKKQSGGSFILADRRRIKPTQVFDAYPSEIPEAFKDMFELIEGDATVRERVITSPSKFVIGVREDGLFDVVDPDGKCLNDEPLGEEDAKRLLLALTV